MHLQKPAEHAMQGDNVYSELRHSQHSLFKNFQEYLDIFRDIDAYSTTLTGVQLGGEGWSPLVFLKIGKSVLISERGPDCPSLG